MIMYVFSPSFALPSLPTSAMGPSSARVNHTQRSGQNTEITNRVGSLPRSVTKMEKFYRPRLDRLEEAIATYNADQTYRNAKTLRGLINQFRTEKEDFKMNKKQGHNPKEKVNRLKREKDINQAMRDIAEEQPLLAFKRYNNK